MDKTILLKNEVKEIINELIEDLDKRKNNLKFGEKCAVKEFAENLIKRIDEVMKGKGND